MSKVTHDDQVAQMAELACFYVDPAGKWLRMDYCDMEEGYFQCHDEESYEEYRIEFSDVDFGGEECFHELVKMEVPEAKK